MHDVYGLHELSVLMGRNMCILLCKKAVVRIYRDFVFTKFSPVGFR